MKRESWIRNAVWGLLAAGIAITAGTSVAEAQLNPRARPRFGQASLRAGFMPDPHLVSGTTGGPISISGIQGQGVCRGYTTSEPSHVIRSRTGFRNIRFVVQADRDATLVVILPNGQILCDDDGGEGVNPLIQTASPPGDIAVWVGSYSSGGQGSSYRMGVTELGHITASNLGGGGVVQPQPPINQPPMVGGGINPGMPPQYGTAQLNRGFMPDPHILSGSAGGPVQGSNVQNGCRGYMSVNPSHVIMTRSGFGNLRFIVNSPVDTTLTVMLPDGRILCNDDGGQGVNPLIETASPPGAIRVWVGSYRQGQMGAYNIGFSELASVGTNNIPAPGGGMVQPPPPVVQPPPPVADIVQMTVDIPVTLLGPGLSPGTVAMWNPSGGPPTQVTIQGRNLVVGNVTLGSIPPTMRDPVVTITQRRNGTLVARAEQPPMGGGDQGQQLLMQVRWQGRPTVANRWSGTAAQRGPRWAR